MFHKDILICGVGGQGTVLASKVIAAAAMNCGHTAHSAETIGMAQRGGSVTSHVRIGKDVYSPLIPKGNADLILAFEPAEAVRCLPYLKKDGTVIVSGTPVKPVSAALNDTGYDGAEMLAYLKTKCGCLAIDAENVCAPFGSLRCLNIIILGAAAGTGKLWSNAEDAVLQEIENRLPAKFADTNKEAFLKGVKLGHHF